MVYHIEKIASFSFREFSSCVNCEYVGLCNGGCQYEAAIEKKKLACRKNILDATIDDLIELRYITKEIQEGVYQLDDTKM